LGISHLDLFFLLDRSSRTLAYIVLLLTVALSSCGTLTGKEQLVSIDSEPRGLDLHYQRNGVHEFQGSTPTYLNLDRKLRQRFTLSRPGGSVVASEDITCRLRWGESMVPNALFSVFGVAGAVITAAAVIVDAASGALFECRDRILLKADISHLDELPTQNCPRVLVMPLRHPNLVVSDDLSQRWTQHIRQAPGYQCARFPDGVAVSRALARYNLDNLSEVTIEELRSNQLLKLGLAAWADQIAFLYLVPEEIADAKSEVRSIYVIDSEIYDAHSLAKMPRGRQQRFEIVDESRVSELQRVSTTSWLVRQLPNAITWGPDHDTFGTHRGFISNEKEHRSFPRALSLFGVSAVEHPAAYGSWDYVWSAYPTLSFFYHDRSYSYSDRLVSEVTDGANLRYWLIAEPSLRLTYFYVMPAISLGPTFHTPVGAFGLHFTLGLAVISVTRSDVKERAADAVIAPGLRSFWYGFLSDRVFSYMEFRQTSFQRDPVRSKAYTLDHGFISSIGLGVFLPEVRPWSRRQFSNRFGF